MRGMTCALWGRSFGGNSRGWSGTTGGSSLSRWWRSGRWSGRPPRGGWVAPVAMVLVAIGLVLPTFATGGLAAVGPYLVVLAVGVIVGWWARG
jgi:fatty acid desaturase